MTMQRGDVITMMTRLLEDAVRRDAARAAATVAATSPLLGPEAVLSSINLVSFIMDVEAALADTQAIELTLVNEAALSRKLSPFRTVETLADYVLELTGGGGLPAGAVAS